MQRLELPPAQSDAAVVASALRAARAAKDAAAARAAVVQHAAADAPFRHGPSLATLRSRLESEASLHVELVDDAHLLLVDLL